MSRTVLVYGGCGALGRSIISKFKSCDWTVISVDFNSNDQANHNINIERGQSLETMGKMVLESTDVLMGKDSCMDAIFNVAGGWAGGSASSKDFLQNVSAMISQSVYSSVITANIASHHLSKGGVVSFVGAFAALGPTPGMIAYGLSKSAIHHLVSSLSQKGSGLPDGAHCNAILPVTLDTEMNRKFMPEADFTTWTPLAEISEVYLDWAMGKNRPANGSLLSVITKDSKTSFNPV